MVHDFAKLPFLLLSSNPLRSIPVEKSEARAHIIKAHYRCLFRNTWNPPDNCFENPSQPFLTQTQTLYLSNLGRPQWIQLLFVLVESDSWRGGAVAPSLSGTDSVLIVSVIPSDCFFCSDTDILSRFF